MDLAETSKSPAEYLEKLYNNNTEYKSIIYEMVMEFYDANFEKAHGRPRNFTDRFGPPIFQQPEFLKLMADFAKFRGRPMTILD